MQRLVFYLDKKYRQFCVPQYKVGVDKSTAGFKGKVMFKVYNREKPIKWGIKIFLVSELSTGYICGLEPYFEKSTIALTNRQDLDATSRLVLHLVKKEV